MANTRTFGAVLEDLRYTTFLSFQREKCFNNMLHRFIYYVVGLQLDGHIKEKSLVNYL
jgi:hypothetical protein